jgi:Zn-dependent protease with chaperone function
VSVVLAFPVAAPLLSSVVVLALHRRVGPAFGALALAITAAALTGGLAATAGFYAVSTVVSADGGGWCRALVGHHVHPHPLVGGAAAVVVTLLTARVMRWWLRYRRTLAEVPVGSEAALVVLDRQEPVAYAHPAGSGSVVVSRGLMAHLTPDERLVVLAHERAHLDLHHSRYVTAAELAAAGCPLSAPLARAVRWCTERAADEAAAAIVGDRRLVAETIAKAAMASAPSGLAGVGGSPAVARLDALLGPPPRESLPRRLALVAATVAALAGAAFQAHHLVEAVLDIG